MLSHRQKYERRMARIQEEEEYLSGSAAPPQPAPEPAPSPPKPKAEKAEAPAKPGPSSCPTPGCQRTIADFSDKKNPAKSMNGHIMGCQRRWRLQHSTN
jgi:hypothetical protein